MTSELLHSGKPYIFKFQSTSDSVVCVGVIHASWKFILFAQQSIIFFLYSIRYVPSRYKEVTVDENGSTVVNFVLVPSDDVEGIF